jgi:YVTN family beta-propeller protein
MYDEAAGDVNALQAPSAHTHHGAPKGSPAASTRAPDPPASTSRNVYAATAAGMLSPAVRGDPERVYVPNSDAGTVSVIDPHTFRILTTYTTGASDQHVTPSWDLRRLYVDNTVANTLTVIDPRTARPVRTFHVLDPYNLYFTPDGSKAIVVAEGYQRLDFYNPHTWKLIKQVPIPSPGPDHLDFSANGKSLLISCEYSGILYRVSTTRMRVTGDVIVGGLPVDVKLSPDGRRYYIANQGLGGVTVIDARTLHRIRFIRTGRGAHGLAISRDAARLYVSNRLAGSISVISLATGKLVTTWHVGASPDMLQVSTDGSQLWASNRFADSISVISTKTGRVIHTIQVGASPHGLTFFPQPGRHSLGHNGVYR